MSITAAHFDELKDIAARALRELGFLPDFSHGRSRKPRKP
jgi:hypothetical protein